GEGGEEEGGAEVNRDGARVDDDWPEEGVADHREEDEVEDVDGEARPAVERVTEERAQVEAGRDAGDEQLDGTDGDDEEAPEDEEVVVAHRRRLDLGLGDLLLAKEVDEHHDEAPAELIEAGTSVRAPAQHDADVALHGPGEHAERQGHERCKDELFHWFNSTRQDDITWPSCDRAQSITHSPCECPCACVEVYQYH